MIATRTLIQSLLTVAGTGGSGAIATCAATFTTIEDHLKEDLLDNESEEDWKEIQKKLNNQENLSEYSGLGLEYIKTQENPSDGNSVKEWCGTQYKNRINPVFTSIPWSNSKLLNTTKRFCIRLMEEKLGEHKLNLDEDSDVSETLKSKFESIGSHNESSNGELVEELKEMKEGNKETDWIKLKDWCKKSYKMGFNKNRDNLWKLVQRYCKR